MRHMSKTAGDLPGALPGFRYGIEAVGNGFWLFDAWCRVRNLRNFLSGPPLILHAAERHVVQERPDQAMLPAKEGFTLVWPLDMI